MRCRTGTRSSAPLIAHPCSSLTRYRPVSHIGLISTQGKVSPMAWRGKLHYAWVVAAVTFLALLVAAGLRSTPGVLIVPLEAEFGWSRATISFRSEERRVGKECGARGAAYDRSK